MKLTTRIPKIKRRKKTQEKPRRKSRNRNPTEDLVVTTDDETEYPEELFNHVIPRIDRKLAELPTRHPPVQSTTRKTSNHHRSNPEFHLPFEIKEHIHQRNEKYQEIGELFNWEHVLCSVQHSSELLSTQNNENHPNIPDDVADLDEEKLESLFFEALNGKTTSSDPIKSLEISPSLPSLHLTPTVIQRIQSRLIALFGISRDVIPSGRSDSSLYHEFDSYSPGYPQSS